MSGKNDAGSGNWLPAALTVAAAAALIWAAVHLLPLLILVLLIVMMVLVTRQVVGKPAQKRNRDRALRWRIRCHLRPDSGCASMLELIMHWGKLAAVRHGRRVRPSTGRWRRLWATEGCAVYLGRAQWGKRVWAQLINHTLILSPQQSGKTGWLSREINHHEGPVMCGSSLANLWENTIAARSAAGPVTVFNPLDVAGLPSTVMVDLLDGCEDTGGALQRAEDLILWTDPNSDLAPWQRLAHVSLAALLHAAALQSPQYRSMRTVYNWNARWGEGLVKDILGQAAQRDGGVFRAAYRQIEQFGRTADSIRSVMNDALGWVANPRALAAVTPGADPGIIPFDTTTFLTGRDPGGNWMGYGTLYLIAPGGQQAVIAPLLKALACKVHREAGELATRTRTGRLDPMALWALDELTQTVPVPADLWLADSTNKGIRMVLVAHTYSQLVGRYGQPAAETMWGTTPTLIVFGGLRDAPNDSTVEAISRACGEIQHGGGESFRQVPTLPPAVIRQLPDWWALVIQKNRQPVVVRMRMTWQRHWWQRLLGTGWHRVPVALARQQEPPPLDLGDEPRRLTGGPAPGGWPHTVSTRKDD